MGGSVWGSVGDRQTPGQTVLDWSPRLYFKPAPPLRLPRRNDLLGLHRLIAGMEMYYASPAESRLPVAPRPVSVASIMRRAYLIFQLILDDTTLKTGRRSHLGMRTHIKPLWLCLTERNIAHRDGGPSRTRLPHSPQRAPAGSRARQTQQSSRELKYTYTHTTVQTRRQSRPAAAAIHVPPTARYHVFTPTSARARPPSHDREAPKPSLPSAKNESFSRLRRPSMSAPPRRAASTFPPTFSFAL